MAIGKDWAILSYYQRFEGIVALVLTVVIALIILVALYRLSASVIAGLVLGVLDPLEPGAFQAVFGEILTLLIALEFNHTLQTWSSASRASFKRRSYCSSPCWR